MRPMLTKSTRRMAIVTLSVVLGCAVWLWGRSVGRHEPREDGRWERHIQASDALGVTVRGLLHGRMRRHAASAAHLWQAFLAVDYAAIARNAEEIVAEPRLSQPVVGEDPALVNVTIPPEFFVAQDTLASSAAALAKAATVGDATKVVEAFQKTAASCFGCHARYRGGEPGGLVR